MPNSRTALDISDQVAEADERWQRVISVGTSQFGQRTAISICGPSGAGKTTITRALAGNNPVYVEMTNDNPYLRNLLEGNEPFDAFKNQKWFLDRVTNFVSQADPKFSLILDQDPSAIVLAYSRMFHDEGTITGPEYSELLDGLLKLEEMIRRWQSPRRVLVLDAPAEILHARVLDRYGPARVPPVHWFAKVRNYFERLIPRLPQTVRLSTAELSAEQTIARARQLLATPV